MLSAIQLHRQAPEGITQSLQQRGINAVCVPAHVGSSDLETFLSAAKRSRNIDSVLVTIPHKISSTAFCDHLSERSKFLGSVNVIRKTAKGFEGDMFDGLAYIAALEEKGCSVQGKKILLCGLGGAGGAIAHALVEAGVGELAVFDLDEKRENDTIERLKAVGVSHVRKGSRDLSGFDVAINASPAGMKENDPLPFDVDTLPNGLWAGDVIARPVETRWILEAKKRGSPVVLGIEMFAKVRELLIEFITDEAVSA